MLSFALLIILVLMMLDKMGKGIVLRESTAILYTLTCVIMPLVGYMFYTRENQLARLWVRYMPVPEAVYYEFALPAIAFFCLALTWPMIAKHDSDEDIFLETILNKIRKHLSSQPNTGLYLMGLGMVISLVVRALPAALQFVATIFFFSSFAGLLYVHFSPVLRYKRLIQLGFILFILANALSSGMFTIVAYMGITIFSFFILGNRTSLFKKVLLLICAAAFFIVLQNTKYTYRKMTWRGQYSDNKAQLFIRLFIEDLQKGTALIEEKAFFPIYTRMNQGYNIALVMRRIPSRQPHDNGRNLSLAFASAFVPRALWPDKPEAGGKFNMKFYAGITLKGWSTNIGPLGEAYGSFGVKGGIVFMFFLGVFIRWAYKKVFVISKRIPLLVCWIPVLFFQTTYSSETDTLQILNSLLKSAFFIFVFYKFMPGWFGIEQQKKQTLPQDAPVSA